MAIKRIENTYPIGTILRGQYDQIIVTTSQMPFEGLIGRLSSGKWDSHFMSKNSPLKGKRWLIAHGFVEIQANDLTTFRLNNRLSAKDYTRLLETLDVISIPTLKRIDRRCDAIKTDGTRYLCKIGGQFFAGSFSEVWFGLKFFPWYDTYRQLDSIDEVYEIVEPATCTKSGS